MPGLPADFGLQRDEPSITVSELSRRIEAALAGSLPSTLRVEGEVANASLRNGHRYFTLREPDASIGCVMWASDVRRCRVDVRDGDRLIAVGGVVHWAPGGRTQLRVRRVEPAGEGALMATFRARCSELRELGWFDEAARKALPVCPRRIAVLTSATGAAIADVERTARDRFPACGILLVDVPVQGAAAAGRIAEAIARVNRASAALGVDAIVLTRGGGSLEDLWAFNEMAVARAVHESDLPLVAAIGHESDVTIAELVADARAATPTAAAVLLVPDGAEAALRLGMVERALQRATCERARLARERISAAAASLRAAATGAIDGRRRAIKGLHDRLEAARPDLVLARRRDRMTHLAHRLHGSMRQPLASARRRVEALTVTPVVAGRMNAARSELDVLSRTLRAIDPQAVLERGFSLTMAQDGSLVRRPDQVPAGDLLVTTLAEGRIHSRVEEASAEAP